MTKKITFILILFLFPIFAEPIQEKKKINLIVYVGKYTSTDLLPILFRQKTDYRESYIGVLGINYPMNYRVRFFEIESEALVGKHFGIMNHWEADGLMIARVSNLFGLPMSFAFGEGLSIGSQNPILENQSKGFNLKNGQIERQSIESRNILNYLMVELDYRIWDLPSNPRIFMRVHHRSGIFGFYCPPDPACGSNFISYGFKMSY
ncbi:MAG TPA: hypothetical protein PK079_01335 [Leptospiraceae bacterium]|nr:hypothetical protein [Leptospiraceae bacterium]HMW04843.1 hypothetical protein [Leptospiraceae bacterium]HMX34730.1 hypothetical protein [Leptospiraceae bacterium]HMY30409.1 hypothetical protein [Leptospiraceae bacterium]HMZ64643.1 hypothetical protein [Leptospiraceae bacterium]